MDRKYLEELIKNIQSMVKCPSCGSPYKTNMISILGGTGQTFLVHLECRLCGQPTLATVMFRQQEKEGLAQSDFYGEIQEIGMEGLPGQGIIPSRNIPAQTPEKKVDTDDVINTHKFLKDFDGDFESMLE